MANIQFIPVCSKCEARIFNQVCYEEILGYLAPSGYIYKQYQISPKYCMACGEPFEQITFNLQKNN